MILSNVSFKNDIYIVSKHFTYKNLKSLPLNVSSVHLMYHHSFNQELDSKTTIVKIFAIYNKHYWIDGCETVGSN